MILRTLATGILLVGLGGCSSIDAGGPVKVTTSDMAASADAHVDLPVGATAPIRVDAHCGFEFTQIDGTLWRTRVRDRVAAGQNQSGSSFAQCFPNAYVKLPQALLLPKVRSDGGVRVRRTTLKGGAPVAPHHRQRSRVATCVVQRA